MAAKIDWTKYIEERENSVTQKVLSIIYLQVKNDVNIQVSDLNVSGKVEENNDNAENSDDVPEQFSPAEASLLQKVIRKGLVDSKQDIEVQRQNPNSPLYSVRTFEALKL